MRRSTVDKGTGGLGLDKSLHKVKFAEENKRRNSSVIGKKNTLEGVEQNEEFTKDKLKQKLNKRRKKMIHYNPKATDSVLHLPPHSELEEADIQHLQRAQVCLQVHDLPQI